MKGKLPWQIELYRSFDMEWNLSLMNTICHSRSAVKNVFLCKEEKLEIVEKQKERY